MNFLDSINETYMAPYFTGKGTPVIPPRHSDNRWLNKGRLWRATHSVSDSDTLFLLYPVVTHASCFCYMLPKLSKHKGLPISVALRVGGEKWLTNRGNKTDKFSIMSYDKAHELSAYHTMVDYVIIDWSTVCLKHYMLNEEAFKRTPLAEILDTEITPQQVTVAREVQRVLGNNWCFTDYL